MTDEDFKVTDKRGATSEQPKEPADSSQRPGIEFANLIVSLGTSAMIHMGVIDNPVTKAKEKDISAAKQEIDLIMMLKNKTAGNLNDAEKKVIDQVLAELQLRFIEASK
jgi:hypothetical protein